MFKTDDSLINNLFNLKFKVNNAVPLQKSKNKGGDNWAEKRVAPYDCDLGMAAKVPAGGIIRNAGNVSGNATMCGWGEIYCLVRSVFCCRNGTDADPL